MTQRFLSCEASSLHWLTISELGCALNIYSTQTTRQVVMFSIRQTPQNGDSRRTEKKAHEKLNSCEVSNSLGRGDSSRELPSSCTRNFKDVALMSSHGCCDGYSDVDAQVTDVLVSNTDIFIYSLR